MNKKDWKELFVVTGAVTLMLITVGALIYFTQIDLRWTDVLINSPETIVRFMIYLILVCVIIYGYSLYVNKIRTMPLEKHEKIETQLDELQMQLEKQFEELRGKTTENHDQLLIDVRKELERMKNNAK